MPKVIPPEVGKSYPVRPVYGGYPLPIGLNEGDRVKVVSDLDHGYYDVVAEDGREFHLFMLCVDSGVER